MTQKKSKRTSIKSSLQRNSESKLGLSLALAARLSSLTKRHRRSQEFNSLGKNIGHFFYQISNGRKGRKRKTFYILQLQNAIKNALAQNRTKKDLMNFSLKALTRKILAKESNTSFEVLKSRNTQLPPTIITDQFARHKKRTLRWPNVSSYLSQNDIPPLSARGERFGEFKSKKYLLMTCQSFAKQKFEYLETKDVRYQIRDGEVFNSRAQCRKQGVFINSHCNQRDAGFTGLKVPNSGGTLGLILMKSDTIGNQRKSFARVRASRMKTNIESLDHSKIGLGKSPYLKKHTEVSPKSSVDFSYSSSGIPQFANFSKLLTISKGKPQTLPSIPSKLEISMKDKPLRANTTNTPKSRSFLVEKSLKLPDIKFLCRSRHPKKMQRFQLPRPRVSFSPKKKKMNSLVDISMYVPKDYMVKRNLKTGNIRSIVKAHQTLN